MTKMVLVSFGHEQAAVGDLKPGHTKGLTPCPSMRLSDMLLRNTIGRERSLLKNFSKL